MLDYQKQLQQANRQPDFAQETENRELARELHDVFSQELAALGMEVSTLLESGEVAGPLTERLADLGKRSDVWPTKFIARRGSFIRQS